MKRLAYIVIIVIAVAGLAFAIVQTTGNSSEKTPSYTAVKASSSMPQPEGIPELLKRKRVLGSPEEYDNIKTTYEKAIGALNQDPEDKDALLKLAEVYITEARITAHYRYYHTAAEKVLSRVMKNPGSANNRFLATTYLASVKLSEHQFAKAHELGKQAIEMNPYHSYTYGILVDANVELGHYDQAVVYADSMVAVRPDLRSYSRISYVREIHGDIDGAIKAMTQAKEAGYPGYEESAWTTLQLGKLYERKGNLDEAEKQYKFILDTRKNYAPALAAQAQVAQKRKNYKKSEKLLRKALEIRNDPEFKAQLSNLYDDMGQADKADDLAEEAVNMLSGINRGTDDSESNNIGLESGRFHLNLEGDADKAIHDGKMAYKRRPANIDVNQLLAEAYYMKGNIEKARMHLDKAMATGKRSGEILCVAGLINLKEGHRSRGMKMLKESFEKNPYQLHGLASEGRRKMRPVS